LRQFCGFAPRGKATRGNHERADAVFANVLDRRVSAAAGATRRAPFTFLDREEIRALVAGAGFHDVVMHLDVHVARFPSAEARVRIMMAGTPLATAMAEADPAL